MTPARLLLFSGGMNDFANYARYRRDLSLIARTLLHRGVVSPATITTLLGAGHDPLAVNPGLHLPVAEASADNLRDALIGTPAADVLLFFASNHGGRDDANIQSTLWCWNSQFVTAAQFATWSTLCAAPRQAYVFGQCHSGGFLSPLAASHRTILTACTAYEPSFAAAGGVYDEFIWRVCQAIEAGHRTFDSVFASARAADLQRETPQYWAGDVGGDADILG